MTEKLYDNPAEEPPASVTVLEETDTRDELTYLVRSGNGWTWSRNTSPNLNWADGENWDWGRSLAYADSPLRDITPAIVSTTEPRPAFEAPDDTHPIRVMDDAVSQRTYEYFAAGGVITDPLKSWAAPVTGYTTLDSGTRATFPSGMQRDTQDGKPRYDLIPLWFLRELAELMARGAEKYGDENWTLANTAAEVKRMNASGLRHHYQYLEGDKTENHMAATVFNLFAAEQTSWKVRGDE